MRYLVLALLVATAGCSKDKKEEEAPPAESKITLDAPSDADAAIKIRWIKLKDDKTVLKIKAKNKGEEQSGYKAYPPGHDEAFFHSPRQGQEEARRSEGRRRDQDPSRVDAAPARR